MSREDLASQSGQSRFGPPCAHRTSLCRRAGSRPGASICAQLARRHLQIFLERNTRSAPASGKPRRGPRRNRCRLPSRPAPSKSPGHVVIAQAFRAVQYCAGNGPQPRPAAGSSAMRSSKLGPCEYWRTGACPSCRSDAVDSDDGACSRRGGGARGLISRRVADPADRSETQP